MFELISGTHSQPLQRSAWPMFVSTIAHAAIVGAAVAIPLLYATAQLPEAPVMMAFVAVLPPPPPPPPPLPAPRVTEAPRNQVVPNYFAAPLEAPSFVVPERGIDRGFEGGVPGGVEGGVPGGVIGGIVGGLPSDVPPPPPPPPAPPLKPVRVGGQIQTPALVERIAPDYPQLAVAAHLEGTVILEATVDEGGRVQDARVLRSIPLLDSAALDAVRRWRYSPLMLNGVPQPFILTVTVSFKIGESTIP
jgi:periplasmic protein TonB